MTFSPYLGRWLEQDPIGLEAGDPNLYRFVGDNPTNRTDPSGLKELPSPAMPNYREFENQTGVMNPELFMGYMGIAKGTVEERQVIHGCWGLNALRTGIYQIDDTKTGVAQGETDILQAPGLHLFATREEAVAYQRWLEASWINPPPGYRTVLIAIQNQKVDYATTGKRKKGPTGPEIDPACMVGVKGQGVNVATAFQDSNLNVRFWEWMGTGRAGGDWRIKHRKKLPRGEYPNVVYGVVISASPFAPPRP